MRSFELAANIAAEQRKLTWREKLEEKKRYLEAELSHVNNALEALAEHPDIEKVFEIIELAL